jgi:hypothetical protein
MSRSGTHKGRCQEGIRTWPGDYARRRAGLTVLLDPSLLLPVLPPRGAGGPSPGRSTPRAAGRRPAAAPRWPRRPCLLQPGRGDRLAPRRVHQVRVEAVVLQQVGQPAPAERGLERHWRPRRQIAYQPQERRRAVHHVPVQLHLAVLGDHRHLGPLAVHVDTDVDRHCRVSFPELQDSRPREVVHAGFGCDLTS